MLVIDSQCFQAVKKCCYLTRGVSMHMLLIIYLCYLLVITSTRITSVSVCMFVKFAGDSIAGSFY